MADDERKLPDLVSRVRTVYDGEGIEKAKSEARGLQDELNKVGDSQAPASMDEKWARTQARMDATKTTTKEAGAALGDVAAGGEAAAGSIAGIASVAGGATAAIGAAVAALNAFNRAGAEGNLEGAQLEQYRELRNATDGLTDSLQQLEASGGGAIAALIEPLVTVADGLAEIANAKILGSDESIAETFINAVNPMALVAEALDRIGVGGDAAAESQEELEDRLARTNKRFEEQARAAEESARATDELATAQLDQVEASRTLEQRQARLADAQRNVEEAEKKVSDLRAGNRTEEAIALADKLREAQERLADAHRKVADATITLADKEEDLREAQFRQGVQSEEAIKAGRAVDRAKLDVEGARSDVTDAAGDVTTAKRKLDEATGTQAIADAERDLAAARQTLVDQAAGVAKATADLAAAQAEANGQTFTGQDRIRVYRDALNNLATDLGGPVGEKIRGFAGDVRSVNDAIAAIIAQSPTLEALTGMDFATGGAITPQTARTPAAPAGAAAAAEPARSPVPAVVANNPNPELIGQQGRPNVMNQTNNITVPTTQELAGAIDDELSWGRAHYE